MNEKRDEEGGGESVGRVGREAMIVFEGDVADRSER